VTGPQLDWIAEARVLVSAVDASLDGIASWLGEAAEPDDSGLRAGAGALPGAASVTVMARNGVLDSLSAWYPGQTGPTLAEAEAVLGEAVDLPRLAASPPQVAFPPFLGAAAACLIAATTWDPASRGDARRLFQLTLRRDPL
jgi:hypothetical protein